MKNELDPSEKIIEEEASSYKKVSDLEKKKIEAIIEKSSKKKVITLRLLISSILHKYINNRLVDKNEILKVSELIDANRWT